MIPKKPPQAMLSRSAAPRAPTVPRPIAQRRAGPVGAPGVVQGTFRSLPMPQPIPPGGAAVQRRGGGGSDAFLVNLPASHGGQALPDEVRSGMEAALNADFSDVRVYVGPQATSIGALAFTRGSDIFFAPGQYNPSTLHGRELLGHELTHVVQQRQGRVTNPFGSGVAVVSDRSLEAEADQMGRRAAAMSILRKARR